MSCILRISGTYLDVDALLGVLPFEPYRIDRKGEPHFKPSTRITTTHVASGIHIEVSDADIMDFDAQIEETIEFLLANTQKLSAITGFPGIDRATLDFGIERQDVLVQTDYLPPELLRLAGNFGLGIELSHYPISNEP